MRRQGAYLIWCNTVLNNHKWVSGWTFNYLTNWLIDWMTDWMNYWLFGSLLDWMGGSKQNDRLIGEELSIETEALKSLSIRRTIKRFNLTDRLMWVLYFCDWLTDWVIVLQSDWQTYRLNNWLNGYLAKGLANIDWTGKQTESLTDCCLAQNSKKRIDWLTTCKWLPNAWRISSLTNC